MSGEGDRDQKTPSALRNEWNYQFPAHYHRNIIRNLGKIVEKNEVVRWANSVNVSHRSWQNEVMTVALIDAMLRFFLEEMETLVNITPEKSRPTASSKRR
jgi:hypothetical protein